VTKELCYPHGHYHENSSAPRSIGQVFGPEARTSVNSPLALATSIDGATKGTTVQFDLGFMTMTRVQAQVLCKAVV
jgi:hypothetical protein